MFRFLRGAMFWVLFAILGAGVYLFFQGNSFGNDDTEAQITQSIPKEIPSLNALLVQVDDISGNRRILDCSTNGCISKVPPSSVRESPLSDGTNWYRYAQRTEKNKTTATVLEKIDSQGNVKTITEENPLVKPRAMMISTDGTKIAYFLDNIHDNLDLTELWTYDSKEGGTKVIVEKLYRPDIASKVRWNASSRVVWFLQENEKKELIAASLSGGGSLRFTGVNWNEHAAAADTGVMDMNDDMSLLVFAETATPGYSRMFIARNNEAVTVKPVKGNIVFVRWMENGALLYATQDGKNLSFWMANATKEWPIARMEATFESAHSPGTSTLAAFIASPKHGERHLYVLQISTGLIKDEVVIPSFPGKTYVVQTSESSLHSSQAVAGATSVISDGEVVAFVEHHMQVIAEDANAKPSRLLITDIQNTSFIDYVDGSGEEQRMLVTIVDTLNPEWKIIARYKTINGTWHREDTTGNTEPKVVRLYEWEESLSQWILKQKY
ncbi:MAG TPA: hypothetical protein VJI96_01175 [Candidatus Andersenbacteria bacterium]|nr:hypothetical protein [Candidatus Andersenbacteria bacterium]